jgi:hypothetical protein
MAVRRPRARVSSSVLSPEASPYDAICLIIGEGLRKRYGLPQQATNYMDVLLQELDDDEEANSNSNGASTNSNGAGK